MKSLEKVNGLVETDANNGITRRYTKKYHGKNKNDEKTKSL